MSYHVASINWKQRWMAVHATEVLGVIEKLATTATEVAVAVANLVATLLAA